MLRVLSPESEGAVAWDDPDLGIDWRIPREKVALSEKDKGHKRLKEQIDTEVFARFLTKKLFYETQLL